MSTQWAYGVTGDGKKRWLPTRTIIEQNHDVIWFHMLIIACVFLIPICPHFIHIIYRPAHSSRHGSSYAPTTLAY